MLLASCVLTGCVAVEYTAVLLLSSRQLLVQGIFYTEIFLGRMLVCNCWLLYIIVKVTVAGFIWYTGWLLFLWISTSL